MALNLREVTQHTVLAVCRLDAGDGGRQVAPNALSIAQAHFSPAAWFRAIYADDAPVGFVMLYDPTLAAGAEESRFFLWRLMVDRLHQGRGYGRGAVELLLEHVRKRPAATQLHASHVPDAPALARFYRLLGFRYTGEEDDGELVMVRDL